MTAPEDRGLSPAQYESMNRTFYRGAPHKYFDRRFTSLLLATADSEHVREAFKQGIKYGRLTVTGNKAFNEEERRDYAATESVLLLHHAGEALLRLYFAHDGIPACPWLEVARLRHFTTFKDKVAKLGAAVLQEETISSLNNVFRGNGDTSKLAYYGWRPEKWADDRLGLQRLIAFITRTLLEDSTLYNAAKHGLALLSQDVGARLDIDLPGVDIGNQGPSLLYLETKPVKSGSSTLNKWHETTTWVQVDSNLALTQLLIQQIESLWTLACLRYADISGGMVHPLNPGLVEELTTGHWKRPIHTPEVSLGLLYQRETPEPSSRRNKKRRR